MPVSVQESRFPKLNVLPDGPGVCAEVKGGWWWGWWKLGTSQEGSHVSTGSPMGQLSLTFVV